MWIFYALAGPIALGMVTATLQYFAARTVPLHVRFIVGYAWFCTISIIVLVPADIWTTLSNEGSKSSIAGLWGWSYWSTFFLTWALVPTLQGYEDAGDFTVSRRLKTSIHQNLILYAAVGIVGAVGVLILILMNKLHWSGILGLAIACSNAFGLITGAFLLGFGLVEIPRSMWRNADLEYRQKYLTHKIARSAVKLDDAHQELSTAIVIAQATSNQMSRNDPLRRYMDIIDDVLAEMWWSIWAAVNLNNKTMNVISPRPTDELVREDPVFKPSGGRMGESDMDYDQDERSMAALRRRLRIAQSSYNRYKSDYTGYVWEALELEDTVKNLGRGNTTDGRFISTTRPPRTGPLAIVLDKAEFVWRCQLRQLLVKASAVMLGIVSAAIVMAEATLLFEADLSLFSAIVGMVGDSEMLVQVVAFIPLAYMCVCTYFSLIKLGMMTIYYLAPKQTSSVSLLMLCSMVARYAAPLCYNFLNLIRLRNSDGTEQLTVFESKMGTMTEIPFIGGQFNRIYPIFMVIYTGLLASNVLNRVMDYFGSWRYFRSHDAEDGEGFDPSGLIILRKERTWLDQGGVVGENVVPLARNFGSAELDIEAEAILGKKGIPEKEGLQSNSRLVSASSAPPAIHEGPGSRHSGRGEKPSSKDAIVSKYSSLRDTSKQSSGNISRGGLPLPQSSHYGNPQGNVQGPPKGSFGNNPRAPVPSTHSSPSLIDLHTAPSSTLPQQSNAIEGSGGFAKNWDTMMSGIQKIGTKRFAPLRQDRSQLQPTSSQTLDSIFQGLRTKRDPGDEEDALDLRLLR